MKTTVKTKLHCGVVVQPANEAGRVHIVIVEGGFAMAQATLDQDQVGALIFGLECAADAARIKLDRQSKEDPFCDCAVPKASCPEHGG